MSLLIGVKRTSLFQHKHSVVGRLSKRCGEKPEGEEN